MATRASFQNLASKLINQTFGDFRDPVVFDLMGEVNYSTQVAPIDSTTTTKGIRLEYTKSQFGGQSVEVGDYKVLVEQQTVDFDVRADNVNMVFNGKAVSIINVGEDAARAVYTLQVRDK